MVSSNYNGTAIGFVLSPAAPVKAAPAASVPAGGEEMVSVPASALMAAENYIRALEAKVAELSRRGF